MRPGCYDVHERVRDMSAGGQLAGLNFPNWTGFSGQVLNEGPDRDVNLVMIKAYNDWHVDEWCGAYPERFIPCGILPLFDVDEAAEEVRRLAAKGCHAVTFSENPAGARHAVDPHRRLGPAVRGVLATRAPCCACTSGRRRRASTTSADAPPSVPMNLSSAMSIYTLGDLMWADFWYRFPDLRFSLTEGDIGWIPYFLQRAEHIHHRHTGWTRHEFPEGSGPTERVPRTDPVLLHQRPRSASSCSTSSTSTTCAGSPTTRTPTAWPNAPEMLEELLAALSDEQVSKLTHENAMRHYQFDPFSVAPARAVHGRRAARRGDRRRRRHPRRAAARRERPCVLPVDPRPATRYTDDVATI